MSEEKMIKRIAKELKNHVPFTAFGAFTGIIIMVIILLCNLPSDISHTVFHVLHPLHVVLSALVTTAMYKKYSNGRLWTAAVIGFLGSIVICSISDIFLPYLGGMLLGFPITLHVCFIEHPWLIIISAFAGIAVGLLWPQTKFPHAGHVLISTWASLFYLTTFGLSANWIPLLPLVFPILFMAVWVPCCVSDIVFPLLFVKKD